MNQMGRTVKSVREAVRAKLWQVAFFQTLFLRPKIRIKIIANGQGCISLDGLWFLTASNLTKVSQAANDAAEVGTSFIVTMGGHT